MKLAYIILAHKNAKQVKRLVDALNDEGVTFVVHISKTSENKFYKEIVEIFQNHSNLYFCKREDGTHNHFGIVKGTINAIRFLIDKKIPFDYLSLISGQDYPIKSKKEIKDFFEKNAGKEFIQYWPMFPDENSEFYKNHPWGDNRQLYRIDRYHIKFCKKKQSIPELLTTRLISHSFIDTLKIFIYESPKYYREKRWKEEFLLFMLSRILPNRRKTPKEFEFFGGKTWWSFTEKSAAYILRFYDKNKKFNSFFKYTLIPDEMYFQTLLLNSPFKEKIENNYLREIEWEGGDGTHPIIFTKKDIERLKNSKNLFARKFDLDIDPDIFDLIDNEILNK